MSENTGERVRSDKKVGQGPKQDTGRSGRGQVAEIIRRSTLLTLTESEGELEYTGYRHAQLAPEHDFCV
jgi:hypothetical protein